MGHIQQEHNAAAEAVLGIRLSRRHEWISNSDGGPTPAVKSTLCRTRTD